MKKFENVIVVLDKGFVYHGDLIVQGDGWMKIEKARNIRRYGTERGLGQLSLTGPTKETTLDLCGPVMFLPHALQQVIECGDAMLA